MSPNKECQWQNLLGCDHWAQSGSPKPTIVGFRDLVGVGIGQFPKKTLAVKAVTQLADASGLSLATFDTNIMP